MKSFIVPCIKCARKYDYFLSMTTFPVSRRPSVEFPSHLVWTEKLASFWTSILSTRSCFYCQLKMAAVHLVACLAVYGEYWNTVQETLNGQTLFENLYCGFSHSPMLLQDVCISFKFWIRTSNLAMWFCDIWDDHVLCSLFGNAYVFLNFIGMLVMQFC